MFKSFYSIGLLLSVFYLFVLQASEIFGSVILAYLLSTVSIFIILSFFYFYSSFYKNVLLFQLKELQKKSENHWYSWFSANSGEFAAIFLFTAPYVIAIASIVKGIVFFAPTLSFLNFIAIAIMSLFCMAMIFIILSTLTDSLQNRKKIA